MSSPPDEYPNRDRSYPSVDSPPDGGSEVERLRARAFSDLSGGSWGAAEQGFTGLLTRGGGDAARDALLLVGVAQARLFGRLDTRGAFAMLQSLLHPGLKLDEASAIRLDIVAGFLFATVDGGLYDPERALRHATAAAERLRASPDVELRALAVSAELLALSLAGEAPRFLAAVEQHRSILDSAREPVARCLRLEILALATLARGDELQAHSAFRLALDAATSLGFAASQARLQACAAQRALDTGRPGLAAGAGRSRHATPPSLIAVPSMTFPLELQTELRRLAPSRVTVLMVGGTPSLKKDAARALHELSPRAGAPFVCFDCAGHDAEAIELSLFGGPAYRPSQAGAVHAAETGTLYVRRVDELPLLMQPRFLRFLDQEKRVRVVVCSDADLELRVRERQFRADLGERLTLVRLVLQGG